MTWRTSLGERVLEGVEAALYLAAMQDAVKSLQETLDLEELEVMSGDDTFDFATAEQKIVLLHACLAALLKSGIEPPSLTNTLEAAAYFPFAFLRVRLEDEILVNREGWFDEEGADLKYHYRRLVWSAIEQYVLPRWKAAEEEYGEDEAVATFSIASDNLELWHDAIKELVDRSFWDRDWMVNSGDAEGLDDVDDSLSEAVGLEDYFTDRLPAVSAEQVTAALAKIQGWKIKESS
ncbi:MAG: hypothetical protein KME43_26500 [Myxacorys chilensis ATA2-1-KO14]|jgi:hypothetical protein|nr:hypothetical protein [Myxacorys chilensis ATA2-1-KO14]